MVSYGAERVNVSLWEESSFPAAGSAATRATLVDLEEP